MVAYQEDQDFRLVLLVKGNQVEELNVSKNFKSESPQILPFTQKTYNG